jgi:hypothetical protein
MKSIIQIYVFKLIKIERIDEKVVKMSEISIIDNNSLIYIESNLIIIFETDKNKPVRPKNENINMNKN